MSLQRHNWCKSRVQCWMDLSCGTEHDPCRMELCSLRTNRSCRSVCQTYNSAGILSVVHWTQQTLSLVPWDLKVGPSLTIPVKRKEQKQKDHDSADRFNGQNENIMTYRLLFSFIDFFPNRLFSSNKQLYKLIQQILTNGRPSVSNATAEFNWEVRTTPFGDQSPGANSLDTLGS